MIGPKVMVPMRGSRTLYYFKGQHSRKTKTNFLGQVMRGSKLPAM